MTAEKIIQRLIDSRYEAYFIGGYVRDKILGIKSLDKDVVTSATPDEILSLFKDQKIDLVGKSFGVVLVNGTEVTTYRRDRYFGLSDKNVEVTFAPSLKEDTERRDFTINTIALDIGGNIIDIHNGIRDLDLRVIKFVGNPLDRIREDPCRIIRACRFIAKIDGIFDGKTFDALKNTAHYINLIPNERIQKEIMKAMKVKAASKFFISLYQIGALEYILPSLQSTMGFTQKNIFHKERLFTHSILTGDKISCKYPLVKLAGYLHDVGKVHTRKYDKKKKTHTYINHDKISTDMVEEELIGLKFSNSDIEFIKNLISIHMYPPPKTGKQLRRLKKRLEELKLTYRNYLRLLIADSHSRYSKIVPTKLNISKIKDLLRLDKELVARNEPFNRKHLAIDGGDLIQILKIKQGKEVGKILDYLLDQVLDNSKLNTRRGLLILATNFITGGVYV